MPPPGNALAFDGVNDYLDLGPAPAAANLGPGGLTLEAWVYFDGNLGPNSILRKTGDYSLLLNNGRLSAEVWPLGTGDPSQRVVTGAVQLPANRWTHVAATWNPAGSAFQLYVNGVLDAGATGSTGSVAGSENLNVGRSSLFQQYFTGRLDEVRVYSAPLTAANLQADMMSTAASVPASQVLYLNMDQGTPATATAGANAAYATLYDLANAYPAALTNFALASGNTASNYVESYALVVPTPTGATGITATGFTATWTAPVLGTATGYLLDVSPSPAFAPAIAGSPFTVAAPATSLALTGLTRSSTYYYRVRALKTGLADQGAFSGTTSVATPLPVGLTAFTATAAGPAAVRLAWTTASEQNSDRFEVERSLDGTRFDRLGPVGAAGNSSSPRAYGYLDERLPAGAAWLYYRLRQVDVDGSFAYSPVRGVARSGPAGLALYPNPAHGGAATLTGTEAGALVRVLDALGRVVTLATADASGTATLVLPAGLASGMYLVRAGVKTLRLAVQ